METIVLIAVLVTIVSAYLLRQYSSHTLEIDDAPASDLSPPERDSELKAA